MTISESNKLANENEANYNGSIHATCDYYKLGKAATKCLGKMMDGLRKIVHLEL